MYDCYLHVRINMLDPDLFGVVSVYGGTQLRMPHGWIYALYSTKENTGQIFYGKSLPQHKL